MKMKHVFLCAATALLVGACAHDYDHHYGGTADGYYSDTGTAMSPPQSYPQPAASPTFRPGMNPNDPRDPQFNSRQTQQVAPSP